MKHKHTGKRPVSLYEEIKLKERNKPVAQVNNFVERNKAGLAKSKERKKPLTAEEKRIEDTKNRLINRVVKNDAGAQRKEDGKGPEELEAADDMLVAFELLTKYKKDKTFIQKEV